MTKSTLAAAALALCAFTGTASAADTLQSRAMSALSVAIASQGNAALIQIREEIRQTALEAIKPFLPEPEKAPQPEKLAETPAVQN